MQLILTSVGDDKDTVFTPDDVARDVVAFFKPAGYVLEPAKGDGAFLKYLPVGTEWCEARDGRDFFAWNQHVDWIVSNPPYSRFADWLRHSFEVADNIVYLIPINKAFNSYQMLTEIHAYGGIPMIYVIGPGASLKFNIGYAIGAVHFKRGYRAGCSLAFRTL